MTRLARPRPQPISSPAFSISQLCIRSASFCAEATPGRTAASRPGDMPAASASPGSSYCWRSAASGSANRLRQPLRSLEFHFVSWHWVVLWRESVPGNHASRVGHGEVGQAIQDPEAMRPACGRRVCQSVGGALCASFECAQRQPAACCMTPVRPHHRKRLRRICQNHATRRFSRPRPRPCDIARPIVGMEGMAGLRVDHELGGLAVLRAPAKHLHVRYRNAWSHRKALVQAP